MCNCCLARLIFDLNVAKSIAPQAPTHEELQKVKEEKIKEKEREKQELMREKEESKKRAMEEKRAKDEEKRNRVKENLKKQEQCPGITKRAIYIWHLQSIQGVGDA